MPFRLLIALVLLLSACRKDNRLREQLSVKTGTVELQSGEVDLKSPIVIDGANDLTINGNGIRIRFGVSADAIFVIRNSKKVRLENIGMEGNRDKSSARFGLPPSDQPMARWNKDNGVLVVDSEDVVLSRLTIRKIVSYGVLVSKSRGVRVEDVLVGDSGSLNAAGKNNATGGILFEEGCEKFTAIHCKLRNIRGNGIWTHSLYTSPRNKDGEFVGNDIRYTGRDALQAGHAVNLKIVNNAGGFIGFPPEIVDLTTLAVPVAVDTAGNVENSLYAGNSFEEVNGKCFDLDGFHDGRVENNECTNRRDYAAYPHGHFGIVLNNSNPDMESKGITIVSNTMTGFRFGGLFLIGQGHVVRENAFRRINLVHCNENASIGCIYKEDEPDMLRSGIYLGQSAHRPSIARGNIVENNIVEGYGMDKYCVVAAPRTSLQANTVRGNKCGTGEAATSPSRR